MKDLNHYFMSPKDSDNEDIAGINQPLSNKRKLKIFSGSLESLPNGLSTKKKKKKKTSLNGLEECDVENSTPKYKRKRKKIKDEEGIKKPRISNVCESFNITEKVAVENEKITNENHIKLTQDTSNENSSNSSFEKEDKYVKANNSLRNYFNKVDKLPDIPLKTNILKVEAIVHYPPSEEKVKPPKGLKTKLRRRISQDLRVEYDIITSEEDTSNLNHSTNDLYPNSPIPVGNSRLPHDDKVLASPEPLKVELNISLLSSDSDNSETLKKDNLTTFGSSRVKHDGTLHSFFKINSAKITDSPVPKLSKEQMLAKKNFLNSGLPENMKKVLLSKKEQVDNFEPAPFPTFPHINQSHILKEQWNLQSAQLKLKKYKSKVIKLPKWSTITCRKQLLPVRTDVRTEIPLLSCKQQKKILKKMLKKEVMDYPIANWYEQLVKLKKVNPNEMWNEKYRPHSSDHLIGNSRNTEKLKLWLEKLNNNGKKAKTTYCSEDEFIKDDEHLVIIKNTAFLKGPSGSGKTSSIYALAEEVGYKIIEINSSFNRMGKKILHEFSEALQSHKVETNTLIFPGLKKNKKDDCKKSLILIEDVDILFPGYDEGFISTIATLAATSKRPVIFTVNEFNPKQLAKLVPLIHFKLDYDFIPLRKLCSWLRIVALTEGIRLEQQDILTFVKWANSDVRKLLLQLQFSLVNGTELIKKDHQLGTNGIWEKLSDCTMSDIKRIKKTASLANLLVVCDMFSLEISNQLMNDEPFHNPWQAIAKDSSELNQPNEFVDYRTAEILADTIRILDDNISSTGHSNTYKTLKNRVENQMVIPVIERDIISTSAVISHTSVSTNYIPALRAIARIENVRLSTQSKRNNRYFNYLQSIGLNEDTIKFSNLLSESLNSSCF